MVLVPGVHGTAAVPRRAVVIVVALTVLLGVALPAGAGRPSAVAPASRAAVAAAVPANQAPTSSVALVADPGGFDHAFYRGEDDAVYLRTFRDGTWSAQSSVGGRIVGAPGAGLAGTRLVVVGRGTDGALWLRTRAQGTWGSWQSLGGVLSAAPAVVGAADGRIDVFARGGDDRLWTRTLRPGGSWSAWAGLDGTLASGPVAVSGSSGNIEVYATRTDRAVWRNTLGTGSWSGWQSLGGRTYTAPSAAWSSQEGRAWVFARGTNDALYLRAGAGWVNLGGLLIDAPAAVGVANGGVDVVVRGRDLDLWSRLYRSGSWSAWTRAWATAAPPAPASSLLGRDWTRIPTTSPVVALTFDAGAGAQGLASIRRTLQRENVPATFYLTGQWVRNFPAEANDVAVAGFVVGNHSDTHPYFTDLTDAQVRAQISTAQTAIVQANGADPRPLFRFPYGDVDGRVLGLVNNMGYVAVRWTVDSWGWKGTSGGMTQQLVVDRVLGALQPGEIVLMHIGAHPTDRSTLDADALPSIISAVKARGYRFVTLNALTG